jgi:hypothetical protein
VHVLTKIFVVLVSMLAVLLVPLVVVYAHNEDSFKAKFEAAEARAAAANSKLQNEQVAHAAQVSQLQLLLQEMTGSNEGLAKERDIASAEIRHLSSDLSRAENQQSKIRSDLSTIASAVAAGQDLTEDLLSEVRTMRSEALAAERRAVELDEALRDITGQLEVAVAARRAMQEELQQLREEHARALEQVSMYVARFGAIGEPRASAGLETVPVDRRLDATVLNVRREADQTLAEINAGSRDGVKEGWMMIIGRGGTFLGNLRIIAVDINRATGVVELEDPGGRGRVEAGDRVYARPRQS